VRDSGIFKPPIAVSMYWQDNLWLKAPHAIALEVFSH